MYKIDAGRRPSTVFSIRTNSIDGMMREYDYYVIASEEMWRQLEDEAIRTSMTTGEPLIRCAMRTAMSALLKDRESVRLFGWKSGKFLTKVKQTLEDRR